MTSEVACGPSASEGLNWRQTEEQQLIAEQTSKRPSERRWRVGATGQKKPWVHRHPRVGREGQITAGGAGRFSRALQRKPRPGKNCIQHHNFPGCVTPGHASLLPRGSHSKLLERTCVRNLHFCSCLTEFNTGTIALLRKSPISW